MKFPVLERIEFTWHISQSGNEIFIRAEMRIFMI